MNEPDRTEPSSELLPDHAYDAALLANARPSDWTNPQPAPSTQQPLAGLVEVIGRSSRSRTVASLPSGGVTVGPVTISPVASVLMPWAVNALVRVETTRL